MGRPVKGKKPNQYIIVDNEGYLTVASAKLEHEIEEGEDKLIEALEEIAEDNPDDISKYKVFQLVPVRFKAQVRVIETEVSVTLGC